MKNSTLTLLAVVGIGLVGIPVSKAEAQRHRSLSAREALDLVAHRFGQEHTQWIVEMRGYEGVPEPEEWELSLWDPRSRYQVQEFWAGDGRATDEGSSDQFYPKRSPFGFLRLSDLKLDSRAAFTIAEGEARKARMGFDSLNYVLRCREFSREPVWTLELIDASDHLSGKVYISGSTGEVLRTVWIYRGTRGRPDGSPLVVDTAAPHEGGEPADSGARSLSSNTQGSGADQQRSQSGGSSRKVNPEPPGPPHQHPPNGDGSGTVNPEQRGPMPNLPKPPVPPSSGGGTDTRIPPPPVPPAP